MRGLVAGQVVRRQGRKALTRELTEVMDRKQKLALAMRSQFRQPRGFVAGSSGGRWPYGRRTASATCGPSACSGWNHHVLEVGFGPGIAIRALSRRATHGLVCGIDHSAVMVRHATRRNAAAVRAGRVDLRLASVEQ